MNKEQLKIEIEKLAKAENITFIKACQLIQSACALSNNEKLITVIHDLKMESLNS
jgi:hypothetical protein